MAERKSKMQCQKCGGEMNHHADKLQDPIDRRQEADVDFTLGGLIQETHGCPACGNVESRLAPSVR